MTASWQESYGKSGQCVKKQRHHFADKGLSSQSYGLSSGHVWLSELYHKESRAPKSWCFWTVVLEKTLESPLDCKEIKPVNLRGITPEYSLEGLMLKLNSNILVTWCKQLTHWKRPWCWERVKAEEGNRGWNGWMASPYEMDMNLGKLWEMVRSMGSRSQTWLGNWTTVYLEGGNCSVNSH